MMMVTTPMMTTKAEKVTNFFDEHIRALNQYGVFSLTLTSTTQPFTYQLNSSGSGTDKSAEDKHTLTSSVTVRQPASKVLELVHLSFVRKYVL